MKKTPVWKTIAERITRDIAKGHFNPGDKLPTEAELAARFNVNRHTVRHALSALVKERLIYTRRGAGTFVAGKPVAYALGKRVRFHQSITAEGHAAEKRVLHLATRPGDHEERAALALHDGAEVHVFEGLALIDQVPVSHFLSVFPAARFPDLPAALTENPSVTHAFAAAGVADFTRRQTRITAVAANATTAQHLNLRAGAALLRSIGVNVDMEGRPVEYGRTWFSGDHIELVVEP